MDKRNLLLNCLWFTGRFDRMLLITGELGKLKKVAEFMGMESPVSDGPVVMAMAMEASH